jgi:hypothetical protein
MAKIDRPWWGNSDTLWGGETFASTQTKARLGVRSGDQFRIEKSPKAVRLIPHPKNGGTWKNSHSKTAPVVMTRARVKRKRHERAFSMMVKITQGSAPTELFLIERKNGTIAITDDLSDPGTGGGTASVER